MAFRPWRANATSISLYNNTLQKLLSGQLPHNPFHLQSTQGSQNLGRVQAGALDKVIDVYGFFGAEQLLELFSEPFSPAADK